MKRPKTRAKKTTTIQLEKINQKISAKEGRLKRYRDGVKQYKQNRTSKRIQQNRGQRMQTK